MFILRDSFILRDPNSPVHCRSSPLVHHMLMVIASGLSEYKMLQPVFPWPWFLGSGAFMKLIRGLISLFIKWEGPIGLKLGKVMSLCDLRHFEPSFFQSRLFSVFTWFLLKEAFPFPESRRQVQSRDAVKVKVTQSCPTLCYPMDYTVHGILQARVLEWVAFPFSRESSQPRDEETRWISFI